MEEGSSKRGANGMILTKKGSPRSLKDSTHNKDQNPRLCSRIGCCGRANSSTSIQIPCSSDKPKSSKIKPQSSSGKEVISTSSRTLSTPPPLKKPLNRTAGPSTNPRTGRKLLNEATSSAAERPCFRRKDLVHEAGSSSSSKSKKQNPFPPTARNTKPRSGISTSYPRQPRTEKGSKPDRVLRPLPSYTRSTLTIGNVINPVSESDRSINLSDASSSVASDETTSSRSSHNRETRRYSMDGIPEVLLALERIDHNDELSYEQLLLVETNLFLSGLSFFDQHRDMRLDIDNMTYEELLALEEKIGSVSTALTEKQVAECIAVVPFKTKEVGASRGEVKCSVCQDEYSDGEEIGRLQCDHRFHVSCIQQWFKLKNWCPVCKSSASST